MKDKQALLENKESEKAPPLVEGNDFYFENGLMVLTASYLLDRGYCCGNDCRNCPFTGEAKRKLK